MGFQLDMTCPHLQSGREMSREQMGKGARLAPRHRADHGLYALLVVSLAACGSEPSPDLGNTSSAVINVTEFATLAPDDSKPDDRFGFSMDADENTLVVGAITANDNGNDAGKAYVYTRSMGAWQLEATLLPDSVGENDAFGSNVAVNGDLIAVTAKGDGSDPGTYRGSVYVFMRQAGVWTEKAKLEPTSTSVTSLRFGSSLALDGTTLIVGAPGERSRQGVAHVYEYDGTTWVERAQLLSPPNPKTTNHPDNLGSTAALQGDIALIGAASRDILGPNTGIVYEFTRTGTSWALTQALQPDDPAAGQVFGSGDLGLDGDTLLVGARGDNSNAGAAYVFVRDTSGAWTQQAKLKGDAIGMLDQFGSSLALSGDTAVIGAPYDNGTASYSGSASLYTRRDGVWTEDGRLIAQYGNYYATLGRSVALFQGMALAGAPSSPSQDTANGKVYAFATGANCSDADLGSWDFCTPECPCSEGQGDCDADADCESGHFCLHDGGTAYGWEDPEMDVCVAYCPTLGVGAGNFCTPECPCVEGEGDCDSSSDCEDGLHCVKDVGTEYGYEDPELDVCGCPTTGQGASNFCSDACPCAAGEGDCDSDSECQDGLVCNRDVGALYGYEADVDVCEAVAASLAP